MLCGAPASWNYPIGYRLQVSADDADWGAPVAEGQGSPGTTVIFYIAGDNGSIPEGSTNGTSNEMTYFNAVAESVADQLV